MQTACGAETAVETKYDGPCACRFVRREEFGEAEQVEWCGLHSRRQEELESLMAAAKEAADVLRSEAETLRDCHTISGQWVGADREAKEQYDQMTSLADRLTPPPRSPHVDSLCGASDIIAVRDKGDAEVFGER